MIDMVEKTITIAIEANIARFKKGMEEARRGMRKVGEEVKEDARKASKGIRRMFDGSGIRAFTDAMKGISPVFDSVIGTIGEMKSRMESAGKAGKMAMLGIKLAVGGLAVGIGVMLGKAIMETTGKLAKLSDPARFDKANSEMKESIRELKTSLGELASPVFEYLAKGVSALAKGLTWVVEKIAMLVGFLQGLLGIGHQVNQTLNGTAGAMAEAGASADAGLSSFDKLNTLNVDEMGDIEQVSKMAGMMDDMRKAGEDSAKAISDAFKPIRDLFHADLGSIWRGFTKSAVDAWTNVRTMAGQAWQTIRESVSGTWSGMVGWASDAWDSVRTKAGEVWTSISSAFKDTWTGLKEWLVGGFTKVGEAVSGIFKGVVRAFKRAWDVTFGAIQGAIRWILGKVEWLVGKIQGLKDAIGGFGSKVSGAVGGFFGGLAEKVGNIFGFAKGGLFQPNSPQLAVIGDNRTEPEVVAPRSMIVDAMRQVMAESDGRQDRPIYLQINGKTFARYVYDDLDAESRRRGVRSIA